VQEPAQARCRPDLQDAVAAQVAVLGGRRADAHGLVRHADMHCVAVGVAARRHAGAVSGSLCVPQPALASMGA